MKKNYKDSKKAWSEHTPALKKYRIVKHQAMMAYVDAGLKHSSPSTTDWLLNWVDA